MASGEGRITGRMQTCVPSLLEQPLLTAEFLAVDTETNGLAGEQCEMTEVGAVLVGGGELHERWCSLVRVQAPLRRGIQRFTGISQAMVDEAPEPRDVLPRLAEMMRERVLVAHNAPIDRRVLRQAFAGAGLEWPDPPMLCTASLARRLLPLQRERKLGALADALGIETRGAHRALVDAETCGRVLCALFPRLCGQAATIGEAVAMLRPTRPRRRARAPREAARRGAGRSLPQLDFSELPKDPGVYLFRDAAGRPLYVGKSVSIRSRARAHFAPSSPRAAWTTQAEVLDYRPTRSELGALILENRLIKELRPPGNVNLRKLDDRGVYVSCRLDIPFPVLEVASEPAAGHAVNVGPLRSSRLAGELVEQLDSLFSLRHCGRRLPRREHPSAYGQMGRCLSPCLGDLDPNLYRRRLDAALGLFAGRDPGRALIDHVEGQMRTAAGEQRYERADWLRRRARRLEAIMRGIGGVMEAMHAHPRLVTAPHPLGGPGDAFWIVGGRLVDWGPVPAEAAELEERSRRALRHRPRPGDVGAYLPKGEVDEVRILAWYLESHPELAVTPLTAVSR